MSYTLNKTGVQIDAILDRAETGGEIDQELALKAPLASPALTGTPTAPTPAEGDNSTKIATTAFVKAATGQLIEESIGPDDILSVPDGADNVPMLSLKAYITALQDLHGYANPWPAGGGKNKFAPESGTYSESGITVNGADTGIYTASGTADETLALRVSSQFTLKANTTYYLKGFWSGLTPADATAKLDIRTGDSGAGWLFSELEGSYTPTADTNAYLFVRVNNGYAIPSNVTFKPYLSTNSDLSTWTPYSNICPISGWTGAEAVVTGKNLLDASGFEQGGLVIGAEGTDYSAAKVANNGRIRLANLFYIPEGTTFTVSIKTGYDFCIYRYDKYGKAKGSASGYVNAPTTETSYGAVAIALKFTNSAYFTPSEALNAEIQLEVGSAATDYAPFVGTTYPISWTDEAGTVYGGYVDFVSGELVVTMASKTYNNASDFSLSHTSGGYGAFIANISGAKRFTDASQIISNEFEVGDYGVNPEYWNSPSRNIIMTDISSVEGRFGLVLQGVLDTTDLGTWLTANPLQLVYELATPLTYSLEGLTIPTLKGENNVWADCGQSEMTYYADLKAYIDKKIAEAL